MRAVNVQSWRDPVLLSRIGESVFAEIRRVVRNKEGIALVKPFDVTGCAEPDSTVAANDILIFVFVFVDGIWSVQF